MSAPCGMPPDVCAECGYRCVSVRRIPEAPRRPIDVPAIFPLRGVSLRGLPGCEDGRRILPHGADE